MLGEHLDGDGAVQAGIPRLLDLTHPALTDQADHFVRADLRAFAQGHSVRRSAVMPPSPILAVTEYGARVVPGLRGMGQGTGTRSNSSWVQLRTRMICGVAVSPSVCPVSLIIRNRCPSGATSYVRPVRNPAQVGPVPQ